jgi:hypothetical protein
MYNILSIGRAKCVWDALFDLSSFLLFTHLLHKLKTLRSGVADYYVIFLMTLYHTISWWWSYTCSGEQNEFVELDLFFQIVRSATPDLPLMSWVDLTIAHYVGCVTKLTLKGSLCHLTQQTRSRGSTIPQCIWDISDVVFTCNKRDKFRWWKV